MMATRGGERGFTLLEVMIALAILAMSITMLLSATASNVKLAQRAQVLGVVTNLTRAKMYDLEEELLQEGFQDTDQELDGDFSDENPNDIFGEIAWKATIEKIELPGLNDAQQAAGAAAGGGLGGGGIGGGIGGMFGGGAQPGQPGGDPGNTSAAGAAALTSQFETVATILEQAMRKVTLTVTWKVGDDEESLTVVAYFTDPTAVDQAVGGFGGGQTIPGAGAGAGGATP